MKGMKYTLKRSNRRTCAIHIIGGSLEVRAPLHMPREAIDDFVHLKAPWIEDKLAESQKRLTEREAFALDYGETLSYRGKLLTIVARKGNKAGFTLEEFYLPHGLKPDRIKEVARQIYRLSAKKYILEKVIYYADLMNLKPKEVKINGAKTRWASCSAKGNLNFSWRLMMAHDDFIDYVVIHELAHLKEMNHSPRFWQVVETYLPDYKERQKGLKDLQKQLQKESWD